MTDNNCPIEENIEKESNIPVDILIIGAGLSGLTSALKILQKEPTLSVKILEANDRIGGQLYRSTSLGEMGGKWITDDQYHIYNMLTTFKIPLRRRVACAGPQFKRCWQLDRCTFAFFAKFELRRYTIELDIKAQLYRPGACESPQFSQSMESHIDSKLFFSNSRVFMKNFVRLTSGTKAHSISYQDYMRILYSCNGLSTLLHLYLSESSGQLEFSSDQLLLALESKIRKAIIHLSTKVCELTHLKNSVVVKDSNGLLHTASVVIVAIPSNRLYEITIIPQLPKEISLPLPPPNGEQLMMTSIIAQYDESYWRQKGYSGNFISDKPLIYGQEYLNKYYYAVILHSTSARDSHISICFDTLAEHFGDEMCHPLAYEQYTFEQSSLAFLPQTTPWNRLIWSSSSTAATCYRGCLSGAVQSGLRAAMNAMLILRPQSISWKDVAEIQRPNVVYQRIMDTNCCVYFHSYREIDEQLMLIDSKTTMSDGAKLYDKIILEKIDKLDY